MGSPDEILDTFIKNDEASIVATVDSLIEVMKNVEQQEDAENKAYSFMLKISHEIRNISHSSEKHNGLVHLLKSLKSNGHLEGDKYKIWSGNIWSDLPMLGICMREEWNCSPEDTTPFQWENMNAFAAKLSTHEVMDFSCYCIWCYRESLEEASTQSLEYTLPAVMVWLEYAGPAMVKWVQDQRNFEWGGSHGDPAALGNLAKKAGLEQRGFSLQRWQFWRQRLHQISQCQDRASISENATELASHCLQKMESLLKPIADSNSE